MKPKTPPKPPVKPTSNLKAPTKSTKKRTRYRSPFPDNKPDKAWAQGDYIFTGQEWSVSKIIGWRINRTSNTIEFHLLWFDKSKTWQPIEGAAKYGRLLVDFLHDASQPPDEWYDGRQDWAKE